VPLRGYRRFAEKISFFVSGFGTRFLGRSALVMFSVSNWLLALEAVTDISKMLPKSSGLMFGICKIYVTPCDPLISRNWVMLLAANSLLHIKITRLNGLISLQVRCKARK
jgi:hypothetical protein